MLLRTLIALSIVAAACASESPSNVSPSTFRGSTMGTTYAVTLVENTISEIQRANLRSVVFKILDEVDRMMSNYREDSELSRFNQSQSTIPFPVSDAMLDVIEESLEISRLTGGAFDVTVGPLVDAWGFGSPGPVETAPDRAQIEALRHEVGYQNIEMNRARSMLRKRRPDVQIDLSAIAKGYGVDRVALALADAGIRDYLVEVGGEVRAYGMNEAEQPWRIAIERPTPGTTAIHRVLRLTDGAVATSGEYRNFYDLQGVRVSHTIDPRSGLPVTHQLRSVSVVSSRCIFADGLATALEVLGPDEGFAIALENDWAALFIVEDKDGKLRDRPTPAFERIMEQQLMN